jgi:transposase-like protein
MMDSKMERNLGMTRARKAPEIPRKEIQTKASTMQPLSVVLPNPEVSEKAERRRFSAEYKLKILREADESRDPGSLGALLRREGLYSSNLTTWRRQREEGTLLALNPKKRGRKASVRNPLLMENEQLRKENDRLHKRLHQAELIIEVQKKVSQILGISLAKPGEGESL